MRYLAIFFTTLIFSIISFAPANAQTFGPDDDGFGGGWDTTNTGATIFEDYEDWMDQCQGQQWECEWAWLDSLVMAQMLGGAGYDGVGAYIVSVSENGTPCFDWDLDGVFDFNGDGDSNDEAGIISGGLAVGFAYVGMEPVAALFALNALYAAWADDNPQSGIGVDKCA